MSSSRPSCPIIIVGNLTVGGTGKTPLVIACTNWLCQQGYRPGIISRGYKGRSRDWPLMVNAQSRPADVGDEPVLIATQTDCPVVVDPDRQRAADYLISNTDVNIIVSDDGLQHYGLGRDIEIAVIDGQRGLGNKHCLPAGPLREPVSRLNECQLIVYNLGTESVTSQHINQLKGASFDYIAALGQAIKVNDPSTSVDIKSFENKNCHLLCAIGNPQGFFNAMNAAGLDGQTHRYPDHHLFSFQDIDFDADVILMTEKDAIKCREIADHRHWAVPIHATLPAGFFTQLKALINAVE